MLVSIICSHTLFKTPLYLVTLNSFRFRQQILVNSLFIFILLNIFYFSLLWLLRYTHYLKVTFNFQIHWVFKLSLILISYFDINFSLKCFLPCNHPLYDFFWLTLLRLSMVKSKIFLVKCHVLHLKICVGYFQISFDTDF